MEFKIDTKNTFSTIAPVIDRINAKLTGTLVEKCREIRQSGSLNLIIDLTHCFELENEALKAFMELHEESYSNGQSLVFTGMNEGIMAVIKNEEADLVMNVAPTMKEAIDIISMEILERELFSEE